MSGNSFGKIFKITTFGESHGKGVGVVIDGCPPNILLTSKKIQKFLDRRKPNKKNIASTTRSEKDKAKIISGVFKNKTTGTPIMIFVENKDFKSKDYKKIAGLFRPGHGDITYLKKYGIRDFRGGGRASARETVARVAAGAVAFEILKKEKIKTIAYTLELAGIKAKEINLQNISKNPLLCPDMKAFKEMEKKIKTIKKSGNSIGGIVEIIIKNMPYGLGEPVFDKLDADLAKAIMSIGAIKGIEIGSGFSASRLLGSENNDEISKKGFLSNNAGGILAGISNGDDIVLRASVKPIPSISIPQKTIDINGKQRQITTQGRHDISAIPRINVVCESMVNITIADHILRQKKNL